MGGKKRESVRQQRRRKAWFEARRVGMADRALPTKATSLELIRAIDMNATAYFGIVKLSRLNLDVKVGPVAAWVKTADDGKMDLLRYAALRGRAAICTAMLRAGAGVASAWDLDSGLEAELWEAAGEDQPRKVAAVLVAVSRMYEFPGSGAVRWKWVARNETNTKILEWVGCGCEMDAEDAWRRLMDSSSAEKVACPKCCDAAMVSPLYTAEEHEESYNVTSDAAGRAKAVWLALSEEERDYRTKAVQMAARRGDSKTLAKFILEKGCDLELRDEFDLTPLLVTALRRHRPTFDLLKAAGADEAESRLDLPLGTPLTATQLMEVNKQTTPAAAASKVEALNAPLVFLVRDALTADEVEDMERLYASLKSSEEEGRQCFIERRNFVDGNRWLEGIVRRSLPNARLAPRCKFVQYLGEEAEMAPHLDLAKPTTELLDFDDTSRSRRRVTSHTWVIYLNSCPLGGATSMLADVRDSSSIIDLVHPTKGGLLIFPHRTPHHGRPLSSKDPLKLIARGELLLLTEEEEQEAGLDAAPSSHDD